MPKIDSEFVSNELARCNRCGYCIRTCPTYRATGHEGYVARARNDLVRAVQRGHSELRQEMRDRFFKCLLCGACTESCLTDVQTDEIMVEAREAYRDTYGEPWLEKFIFRELLPNPQRLTTYARLIALGKNTGISGLARSLGLLKIISPKLDSAEGLIETMPRQFLRDQLPQIGFEAMAGWPAGWFRYEHSARQGPRFLYFVGCGSNYQAPAQVVGALRLLQASGCDITIAPNVCCGLPAYSYGDRAGARLVAELNVDVLAQGDYDLIVTECGSCSSFLKRYDRLLSATAKADKAKAISERVRDITEVLSDLELPPPQPSSHTVTYHDPCHLGRKQGIRAAPRALLRRVPGLEYVELPEADWCCGGAGSFNLANPDLSKEILKRKIEHVRETGADTLITSCPACIIQLAAGAREARLNISVRHLCEFLAAAHIGVE